MDSAPVHGCSARVITSQRAARANADRVLSSTTKPSHAGWKPSGVTGDALELARGHRQRDGSRSSCVQHSLVFDTHFAGRQEMGRYFERASNGKRGLLPWQAAPRPTSDTARLWKTGPARCSPLCSRTAPLLSICCSSEAKPTETVCAFALADDRAAIYNSTRPLRTLLIRF
jgi:hypothetical protein